MNLDSEFLTTPQIMAQLGGCTRDYVSKLARRRGWRFEWYEEGAVRGKRYAAADVEAELQQRQEKASPKTILIKCSCGSTFQLPDPGKATCPGCGAEWRATQEGVFWEKATPDAG